MTTTLSDLSPATVQRLTDAIRLVAECHNWRMTDALLQVWCKKLAPYAKGQAIWKAMSMACEEEKRPSLHRIVELIRGRPETQIWSPPPPPTEKEKYDADVSAILSLLWLHYAKGWELSRVGGETIGRLFAERASKPFPPEDIPRMLDAAKEIYPRELVLAWMADQQRNGGF